MTVFARYLAHGDINYGVVEGDTVKQITTSPFEEYEVTDHTHTLDEVKLLAPCVPGKILAVGLNYRSHLGDTGASRGTSYFLQDDYIAGRPGRHHRHPQGLRRQGG